MALHAPTVRHLGVSPSGAVMKTGGSIDLPLDTLGIFSKDAKKTTKKGLKALGSFAGIDKNSEKLAILFGTKKDAGRMGSTKNSRTLDFTLADVKKVGISHPKVAEQTFDYFRVGWDGVNSDTTFKFHKGQTLEFQMTIGGTPVTFFNNADHYTVRQLINIPNSDFDYCTELDQTICTPVDCRESTITLAKNLNDYRLPGGMVLSDFYDIYPIFNTPSTNASAVEYTYYELGYLGFGGDHELSKVAAQYPGDEVKRDTFTNKFVIVRPTSEGAPAAYAEYSDALLKGCEDCPSGYSLIEGGVVYGIALEDDGADMSSVIAGVAADPLAVPPVEAVIGLPGVVAGSVVKTGQDMGVGHYIVVLTDQLTDAEVDAFVETNPTAIVKFAGVKEDFCNKANSTTHAWTVAGTCEASTAKYRIMVPDDCNGTRLAEVQAAYPDLTVTQVSNANCVSVFETTVETSLSCDEGCNSAIVEQVFTSEAPKPFEIGVYWYPVVTEAAAGATLCGIEIKGKPVVLNANDVSYDELPFIMTSARIISVSGGYHVDYSMNAMAPATPSFRVLQLDRARDLDNLGGSSLKEWEQKGRFYFQNEKPYRSQVERLLTGTQSRLSGLTQYSDLFVTIEKSNKSGIEDRSYTSMSYHVLVPFGRTTEMEVLLRELAGAAGVPFEIK